MYQSPGSWAARLPPALRRLLFADPGRELLRQVDATLLVFGGQVLHVESGSVAEIQAAAGEVDAGSIAACVRKLIGVGDDRSILLLLPPGEFAATETEMPGVSGENLRSALD